MKPDSDKITCPSCSAGFPATRRRCPDESGRRRYRRPDGLRCSVTVIFQGSPRYALWARENSVWAATSGLDDLDAVVAQLRSRRLPGTRSPLRGGQRLAHVLQEVAAVVIAQGLGIVRACLVGDSRVVGSG